MLARLAVIKENRRLYDASLETYAGDALVIRPKAGGDRLLRFNEVQRVLDVELDNMRNEVGRVRALVLKARQVGISTYCAARLYHRITRSPGTRAMMMAHRDDTTNALFGMVKRFAENDPNAPRATRSNKGELEFGEIDSGIVVGTAGAANAGGGRGFTYQYAHLSEVALWQNAQEHALGILEAVPEMNGTEVIQESTAQGMNNFWHLQYMAALRGQSNFRAIFIPYFVHEEYRTDPPPGWEPPEAFRELRDAHSLSDAQLYWAYQKNMALAAQAGEDPDEICWKFRQEYPCTPEEAFRASRRGGFIKASVVAAAINRILPDASDYPLVIGCDFATGGGGEPHEEAAGEEGEDSKGDWNCFISRRGRVAGRELFRAFPDRDAVSVANKLATEINRLNPALVFMDQGGGGAQVHDILVSRGYRNLRLINFGSKAIDNRKYGNRRAEIWGEMRDWLSEEGGCDIPADDALEAELTSVPVHRDEPTLILMPKKLLRQKHGFSPDRADALATTFGAPMPMGPAHRVKITGTEIVDERAGY